MTRDEAIKILSLYDVNGTWYDTNGWNVPADVQAEAFDMAIKALSAPTGGDLISRQAAIDRIRGTGYADQIKENMVFLLHLLPSADRPTGKWIVKQGNYCGVELKEFFCDKCGTRGALRRVYSDPEPLPNFCGHCGADMRGLNDETHKEKTK